MPNDTLVSGTPSERSTNCTDVPPVLAVGSGDEAGGEARELDAHARHSVRDLQRVRAVPSRRGGRHLRAAWAVGAHGNAAKDAAVTRDARSGPPPSRVPFAL